MDNNLELFWLFKLAIVGAIIAYWMTKDNTKYNPKTDATIVEDEQTPVVAPPQEIYREKPMQEPKNPSLYQRIKAQPVALKRFSIVITVLWIFIMTVKYGIFNTHHSNRYDINEYFIFTYMPLIIIYGISWIISGIKRN